MDDGRKWPTLSGKSIDMKKLLSWGLENATRSEDAPETTQTTRPREPLDPKWVDIILGKSDNLRMKECTERALDSDLSIEDRLLALDELELLVEDIDNAQDYCTLNLLPLLLSLIDNADGTLPQELAVHILWILGTMVQNNVPVKLKFLQLNVLELVMRRYLSQDQAQEYTTSKALYVISGLIRHNPEAQQIFLSSLDGQSRMMHLVEADTISSNVVKKILFLLDGMLQEEKPVLDQLNADFFNYIIHTIRVRFYEDEDLMCKALSLISRTTRFTKADSSLVLHWMNDVIAKFGDEVIDVHVKDCLRKACAE